MKSESVLLRARVPAQRLKKAEKILGQLGLKPGDAVNMLLAQIELRQGLPFDLSVAEEEIMTSSQQMEEWEKAFGPY